MRLPDDNVLFQRFFDRWYDEPARTRKVFAHTRPDAERAGPPGTLAHDLSPFERPGQARVARRIHTMVNAVRGDWPSYLPVRPPLSPDWIHEFDQHWNRRRVSRLIATSDPTDFSNELLVLCCELGAALGFCMQALEPSRLRWLYDWPYWESGLLDVESGYRISVFHWGIKKFSSYGIDDGYRAKSLACIDMVRNGWAS